MCPIVCYSSIKKYLHVSLNLFTFTHILILSCRREELNSFDENRAEMLTRRGISVLLCYLNSPVDFETVDVLEVKAILKYM